MRKESGSMGSSYRMFQNYYKKLETILEMVSYQ